MPYPLPLALVYLILWAQEKEIFKGMGIASSLCPEPGPVILFCILHGQAGTETALCPNDFRFSNAAFFGRAARPYIPQSELPIFIFGYLLRTLG